MSYLEIEPARAKSKKADKLWGDPNYVAEEKLDGWRFLMHFGRDLERVYLTGRRVSKVTGLFSEKGELVPELGILHDGLGYTVLDGEIMPPKGAGFRDMASIMNADRETARATIERLGMPTYHVFDLLFVNGEDIRERSFLERRENLERLMRRVGNDHVRLVEHHPVEKPVYEMIVSGGGEGLIVKDIAAEYGSGWYKIKKASTLDVVITGFTSAKFGRTGKYEGQIGAAKVSVYLTNGTLCEVGQVSGMTDEVRLHMTHHPGEWIGKVIEIEAQEWAKDRLRHPRYVRPRPDADARGCTYRKMMADLNGDEYETEQVEEKKAQGTLF